VVCEREKGDAAIREGQKNKKEQGKRSGTWHLQPRKSSTQRSGKRQFPGGGENHVKTETRNSLGGHVAEKTRHLHFRDGS